MQLLMLESLKSLVWPDRLIVISAFRRRQCGKNITGLRARGMNKRSWTEVYPQNMLSHMLESLITHPTTPERSISGEIPSWEVTYPLPAGTFEDDFPAFPWWATLY